MYQCVLINTNKQSIITLKGGMVMAAKMRQNITLDPDVFDEFCYYAGLKGIKNFNVDKSANERIC